LVMPRSPRSERSFDYSTRLEDWSLTDCKRILWRRRGALLWITCMASFGASLITGVQPRVYESRALLEIQSLNENFLNFRDIYPAAASNVESGSYVQTQAELLQQDSLIEEVARKLHLEKRPEFQPPSDLLGKLRGDIRIAPLRNTRIIQIVCDARDAALAAALANSLAQVFIEQGIQARQHAARQTYESLRLQVEELRLGLSEQDLNRTVQLGSVRRSGPLTRETGADHRVYETMLRKLNEARAASMVRQSDIQLTAPAEPAARALKPNLPLNFALGTLGGFVLAIGFVMLHEQSTSALNAPGEAGTYLSLPELGGIPDDGAREWPAPCLFASSTTFRVEKAVLQYPSSCLSESFRSTLVSIVSIDGGHSRILVVTSSRPMEGKTTVVSNLGIAFAETGSKALLIDGDMHHPRLHRIFDQGNGWGLTDILCEGKAIDEIPLDGLVKTTTIPHLYLLPSGAPTDKIFGLPYSSRMSCLFRRFREEFDYVLVDAPPCLEFADARRMAQYADGLVLVVRANYTDRKTAQAAAQRLEGDGARVTGIILNRWDQFRSDVYGHRAFRGRPECPTPDWKPGL
jgi:succinoglycan biosynthesis transport protein ExoP